MANLKTNFNKEITLTESVTIDNIAIIDFRASINAKNPQQINYYSPSIMNTDLYFENRDEINIIRTEFENQVLAEKEKLMIDTTMEV